MARKVTLRPEEKKVSSTVAFTPSMIARIRRVTDNLKGHPSKSGYIADVLAVALEEDEKRLGIV